MCWADATALQHFSPVRKADYGPERASIKKYIYEMEGLPSKLTSKQDHNMFYSLDQHLP